MTRIKIDFKNTYELNNISKDFRLARFLTELKDGGSMLLSIKISKDSHELFDNVYNLSFGPSKGNKRIDDKVEISHLNHSKVFSTILFNAFRYLSANPGHYLGIDGSEILRAWYYWRFLQSNYEYLNHHFNIFGIKHYVRISRLGKSQYENPFDFNDIQSIPEKISTMDNPPEQMYNYFIFSVKKNSSPKFNEEKY